MPQPASQERFMALVEEHKRILHKVAGTYCRTPEDRQDVVQEIVAQLWRSFPRYDESCRFSTWMYRIALNVAISAYRSAARRSRHTVPAADEAILEVAAPADAQGAEAVALADESAARLRQLREAVARLEPLDRALVLLHLEGNPHDTIADVLGISVSNVGTKLGRIRQRLRRELAGAATPS